MGEKYVIAFDQGTTSTRTIIFDLEGKFVEYHKKNWRSIIQKKVEDYIGLDEKPKKKVAKKTVAKKAPAKKAVAKKAEKVVVAKTDVKDDLKVIKGIGSKLEETLNSVSITPYKQLATTTLKDLRALLTEAGVKHKMYDLSGWKAQAKAALKA